VFGAGAVTAFGAGAVTAFGAAALGVVGVAVGVIAIEVAVTTAVGLAGGSVGVAVAAAIAVAVLAAACSAGDRLAVGAGRGGADDAGGGTAVAVAGRTATVGVGVAPPAAHPAAPMVLVSIVTAPFRASARPDTLAPVVKLMLVSARMFPTKVVVVPTVAELPTCQKTLHGEPPLISRTDELLAVVSVLPILNTKTALALP